MKTPCNLKRRMTRRSQRRGAVLVLVALMAVFVAAMVAFSVDVGYLANTRTQLRASADSAALAAAGALSQSSSVSDAETVALTYAQSNVPSHYGTVADASTITFGTWDAASQTFSPTSDNPNAVRVVVERSAARGNSVPNFFGRVLGMNNTDMTAEAIAVGALPAAIDPDSSDSVYVTSTKDLSNVVLQFSDGTHQKFDGLSGYAQTFSGTGEHEGKEIVGVWIKSGCNHSNDGPGYGEYIAYHSDSVTVHGSNNAKGCTPHVTATFEATGATFDSAGSTSPVRLVK